MLRIFCLIYYEPILPFKIAPYLNKISSSSIDISDGLAQDLQHLCKESNVGAYIDLNLLPLSKKCTHLINSNKLKLKNIFSKGDDYQILFTSNKKNRSKISVLSKKLTTKISRIGVINKNKNIIFKYYNNKFKLKASIMGYKHIF